MYEAIYHGVPLVCIPLHGDQFDNAGRVVSGGFSEAWEIKDVDHKRLTKTIINVISDIKYRQNIERVLKRLKNRKQKAEDMAIDWIETVIKENGEMGYLRPVGADLEFYIYFSLDAIFITLCITTLYSI